MKISFLVMILLLCSCKKEAETPVNDPASSPVTNGTTGGTSGGNTGAKPGSVPPPGGRVYTMPKDLHEESGLKNFVIAPAKSFGWQVYFFADTSYATRDPKNQNDINKLVGFSDCFSEHHKNSARFGWVWKEQRKKMELHAYTYVKGQRQYSYIKDVDLEKVYQLSLKVDGKKYIFWADGVEVHMPRSCGDFWAFGYRLYPYFGGDETAPHDMHIWLREM